MDSRRKKRVVQAAVAREAEAACRLSDAIAGTPEAGFEEFESSRLIMDFLGGRGFRVETPWKQMPTAFRAVRGSGGASIGILAEYDALPNCGAREGEWGHGCGHNLLGAGAAAGAVAAAELLVGEGLKGRVVVYGCPAEELLAGKVYMARDGAFVDCDAILGWHPTGSTEIARHGGSAMDSLVFEFFGKTAHGASAHSGRSALDGVMLLDVAANYLREHVEENVRIHMCVVDGGDAPNVVPGYAKSWYYVRGRDREQVDGVRGRLVDCARGAALATGTRVKVTRLTGCYNRLKNEAMAGAVVANLKLFGPPRVSEADRENVRRLGKVAEFNTGLKTEGGGPGRASSDEDSVSWLAPFGRFSVACVSMKDVPGHHRDLAAQTVLPFAHKGLVRAAEIFAGTVVDLCSGAGVLRRARAEFRSKTRGFRYDPLIPARQKPPSARP